MGTYFDILDTHTVNGKTIALYENQLETNTFIVTVQGCIYKGVTFDSLEKSQKVFNKLLKKYRR